jgi:hypothetical protein
MTVMWHPLEWLAAAGPASRRHGAGAVTRAVADAPPARRAAAPEPAMPIPAGVPGPMNVAVSKAAPGDHSSDSVSPVRRRLVGEVRVAAGPLRDLGAVRMLEHALAGIEGVESISMCGPAHHNVWFEGWFGHERELVAQLERALPFGFEVESASGAELGLRVRAG